MKSLQIDCSFITATGYANLAAGLRNLEEVIFDYSSSIHPDAATLDDICTFFETCTQLNCIELMHLRVTPQQMQRIVGPHIKSLILSRMLGNYFEDPYDVNMWKTICESSPNLEVLGVTSDIFYNDMIHISSIPLLKNHCKNLKEVEFDRCADISTFMALVKELPSLRKASVSFEHSRPKKTAFVARMKKINPLLEVHLF